MPTCPFCGSEEIEGAETCSECQQPLDFLSKPRQDTKVERGLHKDRVYMLFPKPPLTVEGTTPVGQVLQLLVERSIGCVVITKGGEVAGIFSERDALIKLGIRTPELMTQPVLAFMTPHPETIAHDAKLAFALHKMDIGGYRHLPVMTEGRLTGMVSVRDILRYLTDDLLSVGT